jgi:membrane protease YdiL (CAAX protease family)
MTSKNITHKFILSTILLIATIFFFVGDHIYSQSTLTVGSKIIVTALLPVLLLGLTLYFRWEERLKKYWEVSFAYFCGSFGLFFGWLGGSWPEKYFGVSASTAQGVAILKFFEVIPVTFTIIILTRIVQGGLAPIYIQKGNIKKGLGLGLLLSSIIMAIYITISWNNIDFEELKSTIGWMVIFAVLNALFEELLIRGLLLKRFIGLLGIAWSLVLSALCYGLFFLGVQSVAGSIPFGVMVVILPLGFLYSYIMQKTESIWGSVSIHTALDLIFLIGAFAIK